MLCCCSCCCCWSHKPTCKVWLKSGQEQLRYWWHWVCVVVVEGGGWWCKVIFVSNPTFELNWGWVGVVTIKNHVKQIVHADTQSSFTHGMVIINHGAKIGPQKMFSLHYCFENHIEGLHCFDLSWPKPPMLQHLLILPSSNFNFKLEDCFILHFSSHTPNHPPKKVVLGSNFYLNPSLKLNLDFNPNLNPKPNLNLN